MKCYEFLYVCLLCVVCVCILGIVYFLVGVVEEIIGLWKGDMIFFYCYWDKDGEMFCERRWIVLLLVLSVY